MKNQAATTKETFALDSLLESIKDGNIEIAQRILRKINETGLEVIVREREGGSETI